METKTTDPQSAEQSCSMTRPTPGRGRIFSTFRSWTIAPAAVARALPGGTVTLLAVVATLSVGLAIGWAEQRDYRDFKHYQRQVMQQSVTGVANQISYLIENYQTSLALFVERHEPMLARLAASPTDEALRDRISAQLTRHFPDHFSFTITDAVGTLIYDDLGERVGDLCRKDIKNFIHHQHQSDVYVHPGPDEYHVDIMIPTSFGGVKNGVFFVSFKPTLFARLLENSRVAGHQLYLVRRDTLDLIDISPEGSRVDLKRDIRLSPDELSRIVYGQNVKGTRWVVVDVPNPELYEARFLKAVLSGSISFAAFLLLIGFLSVRIYRQAQQRAAAQQALRESHDQLESRVTERTRDLQKSNKRLAHEIQERRGTEKRLLAANDLLMQEALERDLREHEMRKLAGVVEQTDDIVMITDQDGIIEYVNSAFERMTGFAKDEVLGMTPAVLKTGMQSPDFYKRLWTNITAGETFRDVFINRKKNGENFYEQKTITPLRDKQGTITHFVSTGKDITEQMETQQRLQYLAHHDPLTGLPNRALFIDRLSHAMTQAQRNHQLIAVMFLDLDRFKTFNDSLGHSVGDELLKHVGERLTGCLRKGDTIARLGGDEFALVLEGLNHVDGATVVAEKILHVLEKPFFINDRELFVSASVGVTIYPFDDEEMDNLLQNADTAMYRAKDNGRNGYQFFSHDMMARATERLDLESTLHHALERDQFVLHYQPRVRVDTGEIVGVEALLRWQHPERGLISPDKFIPLLEETGLIVPVGEWVLHEACRFNRAMQGAGLPPIRVAVNLSARQFRDKGLPDTVARALRSAELDPRYLELEITESLLMENLDTTTQMLKEMNATGIHISVDDFGTGYSSIAYLKRFTINGIKIDRSFVRGLPKDADDAALVKAIIAMARALRLNITAEGVETREQLAFLGAHGCLEAQGFFFARPAALEKVRDWRGHWAARRGEENRQISGDRR